MDESQRKVNYRNFAEAMYKNTFKLNNKKSLQEKLDEYMVQHYIGKIADSDKYLLLIGMNSMLIDCQQRAGQGYFSRQQLNVVKKLIQYYKSGSVLPPMIFLRELETKIHNFNQKHNTKMEDIIRNYAVGQDQSIIFELFISCYQFPMLSRFTGLIEEIIKVYAVDKLTHIIYYYDERAL